MSGVKEDASSTTKRFKDSNEAINPVKRLKKTMYFPVNNLTNPQNDQSNVQKPPIRPININSLTTKVNPVQEINKNSTHNSTKVQKQQELNFLQENSDDSFDGIRWKESPEIKSSHKQSDIKNSFSGLPSSPLKNINPESENVDDRTSDVLNRYGSNFDNVSKRRTPLMTKTRSDITSSSSKHKKQNNEISQLQRAKSGDDYKVKSMSGSITDSFQNTLNNWINKFEADPQDNQNSNLQPGTVDNNETIPENKTLANPNASLQSEDPFSDDDDLFQLLHTQMQPQPISEDKVSMKPPSENVLDDGESTDDPFSDDDSELMAVLKTSTPSVTSEYTKSFQQGIQNFEKLNIENTHQEEDLEEVSDLVYDRVKTQRFRIVNVIEQYYGRNHEKQFILEVVDSMRDKSKILVRGDYCELELEKGDVIHVIVTDSSNPRLIDDMHNLLIWNPDILLSATTIAQQLNCSRKTVILSRYKFPATSTLPIIAGEIVHFIFQECICTEKWDTEFMNQVLDELLSQYMLLIFGIQKEVKEVREEVVKHFDYLQTWFNTYYKQPLSRKNLIDETSERDPIMFAVEEALDIEEEIRSPIFGIKGKIDATITAKFENKKMKGQFMIPMEIKTGREYIYHRAQASLYSLLFKDRYDMTIDSFLLVYTKEKLTQKCNIRISDLRSLVNLRNKVSHYIKNNLKLPPLVKNSNCERCEIRSACMTLNHLTENGTKEESGIEEDLYEAITRDIFENDLYRNYFQHWDELISKEEDISSRAVKDLWTIPAEEKEFQGKCFSDMRITNSNEKESNNFLFSSTHHDKSQNQQFMYTFAKAENASKFNLARSLINVNDKVIISDEEGHFALTTGLVKQITKDFVVISTRRKIITSDYKLKNYNRANNQVFQSVIRSTQQNTQTTIEKKFRIDKDGMFYGLGLARYNVLSLFLPGGASKLRKLVVDLEKPTFGTSSWEIPDAEKFNPDQIAALNKAFSANDYSLIVGMPGTGKTTVIAQLIKVLVSQKKSVLLTSYTNSAVDNILLKLKELDIDFLRLGYPQRVHKDIKDYIPGFKDSITTYEQYVNTYMRPKVIATTCLNITDTCFNLRRTFDYCIVDEASQITLPVNLGPLGFADKFVMVGDHDQLPPLVTHPDKRVKQELSRSLFSLLAKEHPDSISYLTYQYRMNNDIMNVCNTLIYNNKLKCGSEKVAQQSLKIPNSEVLNSFLTEDVPSDSQWIHKVFDEKNKVLFLDYDAVPAVEETVGEMITNTREALLIQQLVNALVLGGVKEDQIGVMSFYRAQLSVLKKNLCNLKDLEILTADQYQGRDKECIIISLVRSNERKFAGNLMTEYRRLNVAATRAKSKLIILGSRFTLSTNELTNTFVDYLESEKWYYPLPQSAHKIYEVPKVNGSSTTSQRSHDSPILNRNPILKNVVQDLTR
ncbi:DNA replication ATP-dependent helicase, putative [Candida dubliniensis CD36]|uniref:DNA replication ATP-dependent helicase/nuclease DNA2 n=1 Tax=Candida dubliniensis (strain CD36 / ATCC MYA-646 / CBS 7987 / NCPF 3949 / NRRL Y-17841) TaxID=573826 RepID=B9WIB7_CANDC|nr:DNA replication ATP-dependent helicase, putative [Candida dubliniensis CD36]CAX40981.1 DNA replication ATP-dependent helicase, putative [Candida dubliniensis CD36]